LFKSPIVISDSRSHAALSSLRQLQLTNKDGIFVRGDGGIVRAEIQQVVGDW